MTPQAPPQPQPANWQDFSAGLPHDLPPEAYDALRHQFYDQHVAPYILSQGGNYQSALDDFMGKTERPTEGFPRTSLTAATAAEALVAPFHTDVRGIEHTRQEAGEQLRAQGASTTPYEMAGEMIGQAPYWAYGLGGAGEVASTVGASARIMRTLAGSIVQGAYDAAKAPDGSKFIEGLKGAALGGATVGAFEGLGGLRDALMGAHDLTPEAAAAVAKMTVRAPMEPAEQQLAAEAVAAAPGIEDTIQKHVTDSIQAATRNGVPQWALDDMSNPGFVKIRMAQSTGREIQIGGPKGIHLDDVNKLIGRVNTVLDQGGKIVSLDGDPKVIQQFQMLLERANAENLKMPWPEKQTTLENDTVAAPKAAMRWGAYEEPHAGMSDETRSLIERAKNYTEKDWAWQGKDAGLHQGGEEEDLAGVLAGSKPTAWIDLQKGDTREQMVDEMLEEARSRGYFTHDMPYDAAPGRTVVISRSAARGQELVDHLTGKIDLDSTELGRLLGMGKYAGRWPEDIEVPPHDPVGEPPATPEPQTIDEGRVRGSADPPLDQTGHRESSNVFDDLAKRGGIHSFISDDSTRGMETMQHGLDAHPLAVLDSIDPRWGSWRKGALEGARESDDTSAANSAMVRETPNVAWPGAAPESTHVGESFNDFTSRTQAADAELMARFKQDPQARIGVITHSHNLRAIEATREDGSVDPDKFLQEETRPDEVFHRPIDAEGNPTGPVQPLAKDAPLEPGPYYIRHGETDWNAKQSQPATAYTVSSRGSVNPPLRDPEGKLVLDYNYKETPLTHRYAGKLGGADDSLGLTFPPVYDAEGHLGKPTIHYNTEGIAGEQAKLPEGEKGNVAKDTIFHENIHAHIFALNMENDIHAAAMHDGGVMVHDIFHEGFPEEVQDVYKKPQYIPEEVYAYTAAAIRTNNESLLDRFGEADTDKAHVLAWAAETSDILAQRVEELPDSLHKRVFERRLDSVIARSSHMLDDIARVFDNAPGEIGLEDGRWIYRESDTGQTWHFDDRNGLASFLEQEYPKPLLAPELVDTDLLGDAFPRAAMRMQAPNNAKPPITSDPLHPRLVPESHVRGGASALSFFFRPFYDWLGTVSKRFETPELYDMGEKLGDAQNEMNQALSPYIDMLKDSLAKFPKRQADFMQYFRHSDVDKPYVADQLGFNTEERTALADFRAGMGNLWPRLQEYVKDVYPRLAAAGFDVEAVFPRNIASRNGDWYLPMLRSGQLDPRDNNILSVASSYLRSTMQERYLNGPMDDFMDVVDSKDAEGNYKLGILRPLLRRHVEYVRGTPDWTQRAVSNAVMAGVGLINDTLAKANEFLPSGMQIPLVKDTPRDVLNKYILFSYAGGLALRPSVVIRDASQIFLTTFPVLGAEYLWKGMARAFPALREGVEANEYAIAKRYGALIERKNLAEMYAGGGNAEEGGLGTTIEKPLEHFATKAMSYIQWSHNSNRLVAFWGHAQKIGDALEEYAGDQDMAKLTKQSDMWFMNDGMRKRFQHEIQRTNLDDTAATDDLRYRMAKAMVDTTQWNYQRGAAPGLYKYQLGRLFGQYGTWPLNYIEYARRFASSKDPQAFFALGRLVAAHGAILSAGAAAGIDTSHWTFTQPMAYGGGPIFQAVTNIPNTMDFQSQRGSEARRDIKELFWPGLVPGGEEAETIWKAVTSNDPHLYTRMLGFTPLTERAELTGWHKFIP